MAITIFYSWQSDIISKLNRNFIEDALEKAIKRLGQHIEIQEAFREEGMGNRTKTRREYQVYRLSLK